MSDLKPNPVKAPVKVAETAVVAPRKTLEQAFNESCAVEVARAQVHQSVQIPNAGTESSLSVGRPKLKNLKMVFHPGYGLIGSLGGKYFLVPSANVIVCLETL